LNQTLHNYLAKRISVLYFLSLAIWIYLFSVPLDMIHPFSFFDLMKIVLVLIGLRMYDDVMQSEDDSLDKLKLPLLIFFGLIILSWFGDGIEVALLWVYFFALNHILYKALSHRVFWSYVLPALQYPVVFIAITYTYFVDFQIDFHFLLSAFVVFLCAVVFEWLDSSSEQPHSFLIYVFTMIIITLIVFNQLNIISFVAGVFELLCMLVLFIFFKKNMRFWWLLIILILRIIALNFGG